MSSLFGSRLYVRIWLAVVAAVTVLTLVVGWLWQQALDEDRAEREARVTRTIIVRDGTRDIIGQAPARAVSLPGEGWEFEVEMNDGQTLYVLLPRTGRPSNNPGRRAPEWLQTPTGFAWLLGLVALAVALGAYPIVRRLTKRLETLQKGVERWGDGDLSTRLPMQGQDEVAFLATRFNAAAERVQTLLQSHKALLANASHELRSPLARIRMGLELLGHDSAYAPQRAEIARSIDELDQLIDEILLASRLDLIDAREASALGPVEEVDLVGLAAEECARTGADLDIAPGASPALVQGQSRLLRRVLRNLLENARRYGGSGATGAPQVRLSIMRRAPVGVGDASGVVMWVEDRGTGVPPDQRERIFEPFYRLPGASEREGGVGLGLSLVKTIVERHGGVVRCEDRPGGGARFVIELPA
ncbi:MAG: HAMP domain-containing histidine kinase [Hydrogenophaga sp.]|jgi:signal transduction histidine kinase|uniref:HAMP domain-containing sensor histidine kinase n=1 Tax=Hydrogenophaga sp. TaxID=1904254 RepID=UPI001DEC19A6|nr:HAMP domain-containing sensor histidine kinase [Hydrogenophaga sp.]MBW0171740.1 HAMP domain-containing histidine kinase [Hydrogenophaga sp.]MBW0184040.1 HAMP domain-containing histidine kinase [Hydrogenophaga sp.]